MKDQKHDLVPEENPSSDQPGWFEAIKKNMPGIGLFPHCKLGDGFAQFAIGTDTGCMLICRLNRKPMWMRRRSIWKRQRSSLSRKSRFPKMS